MSALGGYRVLWVSWTNPTTVDLHHTEIWASATNDRSAATLRGVPVSAPGEAQTWAFRNVTIGDTWYVWVRSVDRTGNASGWLPSSPTAGWSATVGGLPVGDLPLAKADGTTKGIATFLAAEFDDDGAGLISLDLTMTPTWTGQHTHTVNPVVTNTAPGLVFTDTTASAKSLTLAVDANVAQLRESAGASGSLLCLDLANARVGLGMTIPQALLDVGTTAAVIPSTWLGHIGAEATGLLLNLSVGSDTASRGATLSLEHYRGSHASPTALSADDQIGSLLFVGYTDARRSSAAIRAYAETGYGATGADSPGRLSFWTTPDGSGTLEERMRIDNQGQVGIGTTAPQYALEVRSSTGLGLGIVGRGSDHNASLVPSATSPFDLLTLTALGGSGSWRGALHVDLSYNGGTPFTALTLQATTDGVTAALGLGSTLSASGVTYQAANLLGGLVLLGTSSVQEREQAALIPSWGTSTDASRKSRLVLYAYDTAAREGLRLEASGTAPMIGFLGAGAAIQQPGGAATAGGTYTATEQGMLQKAYDALRTFGLIA